MKKKTKFIVALTLFMAFIFGSLTYAQAAQQSNITVETLPGPSVSQQVVTTLRHSWPWYVVRGSGIVAALSMIILMLSGIGQITGKTFRFLDPLTAWASHRALGIMFGVSLLFHVIGLLFDTYLKFTILDVLIPWRSSFRPMSIGSIHLGSLPIALGIIAFYVCIAIVISSIIWISKKARLWKILHVLSYEAMIMVFFHVLLIGTDFDTGLLKILWILSGIIVGLLSLQRSWRSFTA